MPAGFNLHSCAVASIWLTALAVPLVAVLVDATGTVADGSLAWTVAATAVLVVFGVAYALLFGYVEVITERLSLPRQLLLWFGALVVPTLVAVPLFGAWACVMVSFVCIWPAFSMPWRASLPLMLVALAVTFLFIAEAESPAGWPMYSSVVLTTVTIYGRAQMVAADNKRAKLEAELSLVRQRESIASDVHDLLGHSLTVINLKAELAGRLVDSDPDRARAEIADVSRISRESLADVRATVTKMRAPDFPTELLAARQALEAKGVRFRSSGDAPADPGVSALFAWAVREATTNVLRHANASTCTVTYSPTRLEVTDDGRGVRDAAAGSGLTGLDARAAGAGASLDLHPGPGGSGTTLTVEVDP